ncbi:hypothetical protein D9M68_816590 [compost metagenome]
MPVDALKFAVRNSYKASQGGVRTGAAYLAVHYAEDRVAAGGEINSLMQIRLPSNRVYTVAK